MLFITLGLGAWILEIGRKTRCTTTRRSACSISPMSMRAPHRPSAPSDNACSTTRTPPTSTGLSARRPHRSYANTSGSTSPPSPMNPEQEAGNNHLRRPVCAHRNESISATQWIGLLGGKRGSPSYWPSNRRRKDTHCCSTENRVAARRQPAIPIDRPRSEAWTSSAMTSHMACVSPSLTR